MEWRLLMDRLRNHQNGRNGNDRDDRQHPLHLWLVIQQWLVGIVSAGMVSIGVVVVVTLTIAGCSSPTVAMTPASDRPTPPPTTILTPEQPTKTSPASTITEVAPPESIQALQPYLENYQPRVSILSPKADEVLMDDTVAVRFQVNDLPIFLEPTLGMGPHLEVILDNEPYTMVYDVSQPLVLKGLNAGSHTLRVFASRPWHESFKNDGAFAQTTFHVFAKTQTNVPDPALPLLTYSRPTGSYGAEPIMLDFYLTNAPLHLVAQATADDEILDWRIRATVNGQSFVFDRWQPIYLKGFQPGKNWVKLEFLDEKGEPVQNAFNTTARMIIYEPGGSDGLARLTRGEVALADARRITDPTYTPTAVVPSPAPTEASAPEATPKPEVPAPAPSPSPKPVASPPPVPVVPSSTATPEATPVAPAIVPSPVVLSPASTPATEPETEPETKVGTPPVPDVLTASPTVSPTESVDLPVRSTPVAPSPTPSPSPAASLAPATTAPQDTSVAPPSVITSGEKAALSGSTETISTKSISTETEATASDVAPDLGSPQSSSVQTAADALKGS